MSSSLVPPAFLFHYRFPVARNDALSASSFDAVNLASPLPDLSTLSTQPSFATVRINWNLQGLAVSIFVNRQKKALLPRSSSSKLLADECVRLWIDTRNTRNVHRATRYCQMIEIFPFGSTHKSSKPVARQAFIPNAREDAPQHAGLEIPIHLEAQEDSYLTTVWLSSELLHGFDPQQQSDISFYYEVEDIFSGLQTPFVGPEFPYEYDPSLWLTLDLVN